MVLSLDDLVDDFSLGDCNAARSQGCSRREAADFEILSAR